MKCNHGLLFLKKSNDWQILCKIVSNYLTLFLFLPNASPIQCVACSRGTMP